MWGLPTSAAPGGGPCNNANPALAWCYQAWRWNLDRVEDPNGNVATYRYGVETNNYGRYGNPAQPIGYVRDGYLFSVAYTKRSGAESSPSTARTFVNVEYRCIQLVATCEAPSSANGSSYPDVPVDLICSSTTYCTQLAPSFFSTRRIASIYSDTYKNATFTPSWGVFLYHEFPANTANGTYDQRRLWLRYVQRAGWDKTAGAWLSQPAVRFDSFTSNFPNRYWADVALGGVPPMYFYRVDGVRDELDGQLRVTYGQPTCTTQPAPGRWDLNGCDIFPAWWAPGQGDAGFATFNKYLVTATDQSDPTTGSPTVHTVYQYHDAPAWHYDENPVTVHPTVERVAGPLQGQCRGRVGADEDGHRAVLVPRHERRPARRRRNEERGGDGDRRVDPPG